MIPPIWCEILSWYVDHINMLVLYIVEYDNA